MAGLAAAAGAAAAAFSLLRRANSQGGYGGRKRRALEQQVLVYISFSPRTIGLPFQSRSEEIFQEMELLDSQKDCAKLYLCQLATINEEVICPYLLLCLHFLFCLHLFVYDYRAC